MQKDPLDEMQDPLQNDFSEARPSARTLVGHRFGQRWFRLRRPSRDPRRDSASLLPREAPRAGSWRRS